MLAQNGGGSAWIERFVLYNQPGIVAADPQMSGTHVEYGAETLAADTQRPQHDRQRPVFAHQQHGENA